MEDVLKSFQREVFVQRAGKALAIFLLLQPIQLWLFRFILTFHPLDPVSWLGSAVYLLWQPSHWVYCLGLSITATISMVFYATDSTVVPFIPSSRWQHLIRLLVPRHLLAMSVYMLVGGMSMCFYLGVVGGPLSALSMHCSDNPTPNYRGIIISEMCLQETHLFVVLLGCFLGVMLFLHDYMDRGNFMTFPAVPISGRDAIRQNRSVVIEATKFIFRKLHIFYIIYYLKGGYVRTFVCDLLSLNVPADYLDSVSDFLNVYLFLVCVVYGTFLIYMQLVIRRIYKFLILEPMGFLVESPFVEIPCLVLPCALTTPNPTLLKHLAVQDLLHFSSTKSKKRAQVFTLSQPGGHPHNWNMVRVECLSNLKALSDELSNINKSEKNPSIQHPQQTLKFGPPVFASRTSIVNPSTLHANGHSNIVASPLDKLSSQDGLRHRCSTPMEPRDSINPVLRFRDPLYPVLKDAVWNAFMKLFNYISSFRVVVFVFGTKPETKVSLLFSTGQIYIWEALALSYLVAASYTEDLYGIVQKDLSEILATFIDLQQVLEAHDKQHPIKNQVAGGQTFPFESIKRKQLLVAIKNGMYRICNRFGTVLYSVPRLDTEQTQKLSLYLQNRV